jgi:hypothetical protein
VEKEGLAPGVDAALLAVSTSQSLNISTSRRLRSRRWGVQIKYD